MKKVILRDGRPLHIRELGRGPTIIFLHGFGMHSAHWLPFALPLSLSHRILIPDLRGFGKSHEISHNQACAISNYTEDLEDIVEHYKLNEFKLIGISMGALTGLSYLTKDIRKKVTHYMHIDQAPRCSNNDDWSWGLFGAENKCRLDRAQELIIKLDPYIEVNAPFHVIPKDLRNDLLTELGAFFASACSRPLQKRIAQKLCRQEALITQFMPMNNWPAYIHCLRAYIEQDYDLLENLNEVETPISLIVGMKSEMYPCGGQLRIADQAPNCEVIPFHDSGHTPLIDQPLKLMREINRIAQLR